jgi:hypothetical protein
MELRGLGFEVTCRRWEGRRTGARALTWRAAAADAALEERERASAVADGALGVDVSGGEAARVVDSICRLGCAWRCAGSSARSR